MEATLQGRLINLEQQFLLAILSGDEEALEEFSREWSRVSNHLKTVEAGRELDDKTALLSCHVAGSIENLATCLLHVEEILQDAQSRLHDLIHEVPPNPLETPSHSPSVAPYHLLFSRHLSSAQTTLGQHKTLDAYAYRWLMQNLHNPYPTTMQMQILSDLSGTSAAQVEIWFKEMRDAIGWTKLSREFFASSPGATVAAARRVYLQRDSDMPFGIVFAFTAVKASAEAHFLEHPALREKHFNEDDDLSWTLPGIPEAQNHYLGSEGVFVPFAADFSIPPDDFTYLTDGEESEEEDTTPPPATAGCKRRLTEDVLTSEDSDLARPPKRHQVLPAVKGTFSKQECAPLAPSIAPDLLLERNDTQDTEPTSADMSIPFDSPLHPTSSDSYDTLASICHKRGRAELDEDPSDNFVSRDDVPPRPIQRRKVIESTSPVPSKPVCSSPAVHGNHPSLDPSSPSGDPSSHPSPRSVMEPVLAGAGASSNTDIIDCDSIPSPPKDAAWISMPAIIDVPNSDFLESNPQLPHVPDLEYHLTAGSNSCFSLGDWPSFGELSYLSSSPISSSSSASLDTETPSTSQVLDWSSLTEFFDPVFPTPSQSSSQTSLSTPPNTLPNSQEDSLLTPLLPSYDINQLGSLLDPSTPPSALLPMQPDAFAEDSGLCYTECNELYQPFSYL